VGRATTNLGSGLISFDSLRSSPPPRVPTSPILELEKSFLSKLHFNDLRVEQGIKTFDHSRRVFVFGSNSLAWLLSFSPRDWAVIFVASLSVEDALTRSVHRRMNVVLSKSSDWAAESHSCDVLLGAGSVNSMKNFVEACEISLPVIMLSPPGEPRDVFRTWRFHNVHHHVVGGATLSSAKVWTLNWKFRGPALAVSRQLGHLLDHSTLPSACSREPAFAYLSPEDLLPMTGPLLPVVFPTHATRSKWGVRALTSKEIALCLDAPLWIVSNPLLLGLFNQRHAEGHVIPLKLLQAPLQSLLAELAPAPSSKSSVVPPHVVSPDFSEDPRGSWLPRLQTWLPSSWVDASSVTAKAAKHDDAEIYTGVWDSRISSVLPCSSATLVTLRRACFGWWARRVYRSFRDFLRRQYGAAWCSQLTIARQAGFISSQHQGGGKRKRKRNAEANKNNNNNNNNNNNTTQAKGGIQVPTNLALPSFDLDSFLRDAEVGLNVLHQVLSSEWWDWTKGSSLLFWRWDSVTQVPSARDGMTIFVQSTLPTQMRRPRRPPPDKAKLIGPKVDKVRNRTYILPGDVENVTDFFDVPKGEHDIRVVYNGTASGLNEALWAPGFYLPNADAASRLLMYYSFTMDADLGEMFLNFPMDPAIRPFAGVDLSGISQHLTNPGPQGRRVLERWERLFMGMKSSPYNAVRYFYWAEEFSRGNPVDEGNALRYDRVILNLPGMPEFDPTKPNVMKWNDSVDRLAGDIITFVDDLRASGYDRENAWQVARQITSRLQYLGIQDAARKRRPSSQSGGAWAGTIFEITKDTICKTVSQEKWEKGRSLVREFTERCNDPQQPPRFNHKDLERKRGFLVHLSMTFSSLVPFLKGLHLTIDSWRPLH